ncbi:unnamed protein product [Rhizophagus irregularis]|nr:unnamed protein product [Rhizophagus irregularis]
MVDNKLLSKLSQNLLEVLNDEEYYDITIEVEFLILRYIYGGRIPLEEYPNSKPENKSRPRIINNIKLSLPNYENVSDQVENNKSMVNMTSYNWKVTEEDSKKREELRKSKEILKEKLNKLRHSMLKNPTEEQSKWWEVVTEEPKKWEEPTEEQNNWLEEEPKKWEEQNEWWEPVKSAKSPNEKWVKPAKNPNEKWMKSAKNSNEKWVSTKKWVKPTVEKPKRWVEPTEKPKTLDDDTWW